MTDPICPPGTRFAAAVEAVRAGKASIADAVAQLLRELNDDEMLGLLDGDLSLRAGLAGMMRRYNEVPYEAGRVDRLGIPGIRFTDGPRGVVVGSSTAFPVAIARAATWDIDLEERIGDAIGAEARAQGANLFAGICINLAHAPGWGRAQESYGEEPTLLGAMGVALTTGVKPWVMSCVKHFALNSMEESRFRLDVAVEEDVLREVYLPHFRQVVDAGVDAVMSAYNSVNGEWAGQNTHLLTDILRDEWAFDGFVMTDFIWGLRDPVGSVAAGQDLEMPFRQQRARTLTRALADGRLAKADVERAASRLLTAQVRLALRARPTPDATVIASDEHRALARDAARRGAVLLRNADVAGHPALPLTDLGEGSVAVLGRLADSPNQGDVGSSRVHPPASVTILEGLRARLGNRVLHGEGVDAAVLAQSASAAVVVVGLTSVDEGESLVGVDTASTQLFGGLARFRLVAAALGRVLAWGAKRQKWGGDRRDLRLHPPDVALIRAVAAVNPRTIVVVVGGATVVVDPWDQEVAALLLAWYPGMEGGHAIADVLLGDAEPAGRLPVAIPHRGADLPVLDWDASTAVYDRWSGQRKLDRDGVPAAYPLGFGLGYSTFALTDLTCGSAQDQHFEVSVSVTNTGGATGRHVVQVYAARLCDTGRTVRTLLGFSSVSLEAGESRRLSVSCSIRPLQRWVGAGFMLDAQTVELEVGSYSGDPRALLAQYQVEEWIGPGL